MLKREDTVTDSIQGRLQSYANDAQGDNRTFQVIAWGSNTNDYYYIIDNKIKVEDFVIDNKERLHHGVTLSEDELIDKIKSIKFTNNFIPIILYKEDLFNSSLAGNASKQGIILIYNNDPFVLFHEIGHQACNYSKELSELIIENPNDCFGVYDIKKGKFNGVSYNLEESFCDIFSWVIIKNNIPKKEYSLGYKFVSMLFTYTNIEQFVNKWIEVTK